MERQRQSNFNDFKFIIIIERSNGEHRFTFTYYVYTTHDSIEFVQIDFTNNSNSVNKNDCNVYRNVLFSFWLDKANMNMRQLQLLYCNGIPHTFFRFHPSQLFWLVHCIVVEGSSFPAIYSVMITKIILWFCIGLFWALLKIRFDSASSFHRNLIGKQLSICMCFVCLLLMVEHIRYIIWCYLSGHRNRVIKYAVSENTQRNTLRISV